MCLGFLGLGLAWRQASFHLGAPPLIGGVILTFASITFVFCFIAWMAKILTRPSVIFDDLSVAGARAAVSAGSMCLMLLTIAMTPFAPLPALAVWFLGIALHVVFLGCVIRILAHQPGPVVWPVLFLPFVGLIVGPVGGVGLGYPSLSLWLYRASLLPFLVIFAMTIWRVLHATVPPPLRASHAIPLAPLAVFGLAADALGLTGAFTVFFGASLLMATLLLIRIRWLTTGGWTPGWSAFTFPTASFAALCIVAHARVGGLGVDYVAWAVLFFATVIIPVIVVRMLWFWRLGKLANATGAGIA